MSDKELPKSLDNALMNLTDHPTKTIGKLIGQMVGDLLIIPASYIREYSVYKSLPNSVSANHFKDEIVEKISNIDEDKVSLPESQIICQAIEDSKYCLSHKELRSMFSSLIANSCSIGYNQLMHPSFSNTLKCMSPYDARLFQRLAVAEKSSGRTTEAAEYVVLNNHSEDYLLLYECIIYTDDYFKDFGMQSLSISALKQLGLITYAPSEPANIGEQFTDNDFFRNLKVQYKGTDSYPAARRTQVYLTAYGNALANACSIYPSENE